MRWKKEWRRVALNNLALLAVAGIFYALFDWRTCARATAGGGGDRRRVRRGCSTCSTASNAAIGYTGPTGIRTPRDRCSSFYDLPPVLRWITANIGYHQIHHLAPRIPTNTFAPPMSPRPRCPACRA